MLTLLNEKGVEQVDIVAHSGSAITSANFALQHPEKVRNLVLLNPGGLMGETTTPDFMRRVSRHLTQTSLHPVSNLQVTKKLMRGEKAAIKYVTTQPATAVQEMLAISKAEIHDTLSALHNQGVGVAIVATEDDKLFPARELRGVIPTPQEKQTYSTSPNREVQLDAVISIPGIHNELYTRPNNFMQGVDRLLTVLETKRTARDKIEPARQQPSVKTTK